MDREEEFDSISSKFLGQQGSYAVQTDHFDSSFLVPMPRKNIRNLYGVTGREFVGVDVWNCHEATFLLTSGMPIAGTLKVIYPSSSEFMVESKSFKLYLNSFDFCKMGDTLDKAILNYELQVKNDLTEILKCHVQTRFFRDQNNGSTVDNFYRYEDLQSILKYDLESEQITDYVSDFNHLKFFPSKFNREYFLKTNVLRSRCRHTKQKDTGTAFFYIYTEKTELDPMSLLKHVISLRNLDEFHEFCAEKLFIDLMRSGNVNSCCISLLYSRRGSLDINPIRATSDRVLPLEFIDISRYSYKQQNQ